MAQHTSQQEHHEAENAHHVVPVSIYLGVFGALMVLTVLTTWVAYQDLGRFNIFVALTIAVVKAALVILYFMHVRYSSKLTKVIVCAGFFWLLIMFTMTLSDLLTRNWMGVPGR